MDKQFIFDPDIFIMSVRYAIGRKTLASKIVIDNVKANIDFFPICKLQIILRDVKSDLESYIEYLDNCDVQTWENFIEYLEERINNGKR